MNPPFVIVGVPRSATGYASVLLRALQIDCTHEQVFRPRGALEDVVKWYARGGDTHGDSSWLAWVFLTAIPGPVKVLWTTRNPWAVIDSLANRNDLVREDANLRPGKRAYRDIIAAYCPRVFEHESAVDRAAELLVEWTALTGAALHRCDVTAFRYRVEELDADKVADMLEYLGIYRDRQEIRRALDEVPQNVNAGSKLDYNIPIKNPLIRGYLQEMCPDMKEPTIACGMCKDTPRGCEELEAQMAPELIMEVRSLAARQGYGLDDTSEQEPVLAGVTNDDSEQ